MSFFFFAVVTLGTLLGSHFLLFFIAVRVYNITQPSARLALLIALSVLALSFFLSAILSRLFSNPLTNAFSWIASVWLGLWLHLIVAMALIGLTYALARAIGATPNMRLACGLFVGLAVAITAYGTLNAFRVRVQRVEVQLGDLPDSWRGKTIVQLSDVHLGTIRGLRFLRGVIEKVNALEPELILITGDLFDGMGGDLESFAEPLSTFDAPKGVLFIAGNHEGYLGLTRPLAVVERAGIRILDDEVISIDGLQVVGVSFPEFNMLNKSRSVARLAGEINPDAPSILLYHTPTDVAESSDGRAEQQSRTYFSPDVEFSFAIENGIDLQLSGHTHQGQIFPFTYLTKRIFNGYHYGLHTVGDFSIYITSGTGTWGPPLRTGSHSEIVAIRLP
jgi:predicted MPP superfamily phosphohydrolase